MNGTVRQRGTLARMMAVAAAAVIVGGLVATAVEARPGRGGSVGSRGTKTYSAPPTTNTAPGSVAPIQRSTTPAQAQRLPGTISRPPSQAASPSRGFGSLVMGGLLGAGLFGLLSGAGLFGGLGGFAGFLGLLLQVALIGGLVWLALSLFRRRSQPALAGGPDGSAMMRQSHERPGTAGMTQQRASAGTGQPMGRLQIVADDYNQFEALLSKVHNIYGQRDRTALARYVTPEMMGYFADELDENERRGVRSEVSDPKLLQGDLAEAWTEGNSDYATVAMRYALLDATVEIATGKILDGSRTEPQEVTEVWTFRRQTGAGPQTWRLSAIQQPG